MRDKKCIQTTTFWAENLERDLWEGLDVRIIFQRILEKYSMRAGITGMLL
jgi:hypothetical protein